MINSDTQTQNTLRFVQPRCSVSFPSGIGSILWGGNQAVMSHEIFSRWIGLWALSWVEERKRGGIIRFVGHPKKKKRKRNKRYAAGGRCRMELCGLPPNPHSFIKGYLHATCLNANSIYSPFTWRSPTLRFRHHSSKIGTIFSFPERPAYQPRWDLLQIIIHSITDLTRIPVILYRLDERAGTNPLERPNIYVQDLLSFFRQ